MRRLVKLLAAAVVMLACVSAARADDVDGDGVGDGIDVCNNTPLGTAVDAEGRPLGDIDLDCDTDLDDFALFQQGITGVLAEALGACCYPDSVCIVETEDECAGVWQGVGTTCDPNPCLGVVIETVTVGNPGNAGELSGEGAGGYGPDRICGAVDYVYNIGKYEVTAGQYTEFLNAVAATETYGL